MRSLCSAWSILHLYWVRPIFFLWLWVLHLEVRKPGLFHAYWALISTYGLCFCKCFLTGLDHRCTLPWNDFLSLLPSAFFLWLNNLSFFGFSEMPGPKYPHAKGFFWAVNITISWFFDTRSLYIELSARLQNMQQCICSNWKHYLEAVGKFTKNYKEFIFLCRRL